jgi:DNA-binding response OmpR family regulator
MDTEDEVASNDNRSGVILVAVAEPSTRAVIRAALGRGTVVLAEAATVDSVVAHIEQLRPSMVLLEIGLPGASIDEAVKRIRASDGGRVPVVALAERGNDADWRVALQAGADDVLLRPFSAFQLFAKVRDHMPRALER